MGYFYSNSGFDISDNWSDEYRWTICGAFNDGYPFLTGAYKSDPCLPSLTNATAPLITGTGVVGKTLAINKGAWDAGVTFTYQWKLDGANINGATAATYKPIASQVGKTITVVLTGTKAGYRTEVKNSSNNVVVEAAPVPPVVKAPTTVTIGGFAGNSWWAPSGFTVGIKNGFKAHSKATSVTCTGIVAPGGWPAWQKTLGLKRAALGCAALKSLNPKLKVTLAWKIAKPTDAVLRGIEFKFNK